MSSARRQGAGDSHIDMFGHFVAQIKHLIKVHFDRGEISEHAKALIQTQLARGNQCVHERHLCVAHIRIELEDVIAPDTVDFEAFQRDLRRRVAIDRRTFKAAAKPQKATHDLRAGHRGPPDGYDSDSSSTGTNGSSDTGQLASPTRSKVGGGSARSPAIRRVGDSANTIGRDLLDQALTPRRKQKRNEASARKPSPKSSRGGKPQPDKANPRAKLPEKLQLHEHLNELSPSGSGPMSAPLSAALRISTPSGQGYRAVRARSQSLVESSCSPTSGSAGELDRNSGPPSMHRSRSMGAPSSGPSSGPNSGSPTGGFSAPTGPNRGASSLSFEALRRHMQGPASAIPINSFLGLGAANRRPNKAPRHSTRSAPAFDTDTSGGKPTAPSSARKAPKSRQQMLQALPLHAASPPTHPQSANPRRHRSYKRGTFFADSPPSTLRTGTSGSSGNDSDDNVPKAPRHSSPGPAAQQRGTNFKGVHRGPRRGSIKDQSSPEMSQSPATRPPAKPPSKRKGKAPANVDKKGAARLQQRLQNSPYQAQNQWHKQTKKAPSSSLSRQASGRSKPSQSTRSSASPGTSRSCDGGHRRAALKEKLSSVRRVHSDSSSPRKHGSVQLSPRRRVIRKSSSSSTAASTQSGVGSTPRRMRQESPSKHLGQLEELRLAPAASVGLGVSPIDPNPPGPVSTKNNDAHQADATTLRRKAAAARSATTPKAVTAASLNSRGINMATHISMSPLQLPNNQALGGAGLGAQEASVARIESKVSSESHGAASQQSGVSDSDAREEHKTERDATPMSGTESGDMSPLHLGTPNKPATSSQRPRSLMHNDTNSRTAPPSSSSSDDSSDDAMTPRVSSDDKIRAMARNFVKQCPSVINTTDDHPTLSHHARTLGEKVWTLFKYPLFQVLSPKTAKELVFKNRSVRDEVDPAELARLNKTPHYMDSPRSGLNAVRWLC